MNFLFVGDVIGRPGRFLVKQLLPFLKDKHKIDLTIANGENTAGGLGATPKVLNELFHAGVDIITMGNHVWKKRELIREIDSIKNLIRPANFPKEAPGKGSLLYSLSNNKKVGVINLMGRVFMAPLDCPFKAAQREVEALREMTPIIVVDMHAEATSEKMAMGWFLDGQVSAVIGTHTHIVTADERILHQGTAYITDVGMTGSHDSIIGMKREEVLKRFITQVPCRFQVAREHLNLSGVVINIDDETGKARGIYRIFESLPNFSLLSLEEWEEEEKEGHVDWE